MTDFNGVSYYLKIKKIVVGKQSRKYKTKKSMCYEHLKKKDLPLIA